MPAFSITPREKRTLRFAVMGLAIYLAAFYGIRGLHYLEKQRTAFLQRRAEAQNLSVRLLRHEKKMIQLERLRGSSHLDISRLDQPSLTGEASAAIQRAAQSCGVALGPVRESPGRSAAKELAAMQLEGTGTVKAVMTFLHQLETLGFPLIVESIQIDPDSKSPGQVNLVLRTVLLDASQWQQEEEARDV